MNILFISLFDIRSVHEHNIYSDLMREFAKHGHDVSIVSPLERRVGKNTYFIEESVGKYKNNVHVLKLKTGNIQKTNLIEKGIATILLEQQLKNGIKKFFNNVKYDLILYSTPPITIMNVVKYVKQRDNASTYLMLKDIFPQNAVDLGMISKKGLMGGLYRYFRNKEKKLYEISDRIGCMSLGNMDYVLKHNPEVKKEKVELCPNCIEIQDVSVTKEEKEYLRNKYSIPLKRKVFVYGGNLGKPQGIDFVIECLQAQKNNEDVFFLIVGNGTEYYKLEKFFFTEKPDNMKLLESLPKDEYDKLIATCDVGLIFLDYRFTIPNYPSRLLSYMQAGLPVLACTDKNTDIKLSIEDGKFGWWCESNNVEKFSCCIKQAITSNTDILGMHARLYLKDKFSSDLLYQMIINKDR